MSKLHKEVIYASPLVTVYCHAVESGFQTTQSFIQGSGDSLPDPDEVELDSW